MACQQYSRMEGKTSDRKSPHGIYGFTLPIGHAIADLRRFFREIGQTTGAGSKKQFKSNMSYHY